MGQKINPNGFRLIYKKTCSIWFETFTNYAYLVKKDNQILTILKKKVEEFAINKIKIKRDLVNNKLVIILHTKYPEDITLKHYITSFQSTNKTLFFKTNELFFIKLFKIENPIAKINLIAFIISEQIKERISFERIVQILMIKIEPLNLKGIKIQISGRLNGIEKAKTDWYKKGSIPLNTLFEKIEYTYKNISTKYGSIGLKIWIVLK